MAMPAWLKLAYAVPVDDPFEDDHAVGDRGGHVGIRLELLGEALGDLLLDARIGTGERGVATTRGGRGVCRRLRRGRE
jgi:hypothetical protein